VPSGVYSAKPGREGQTAVASKGEDLATCCCECCDVAYVKRKEEEDAKEERYSQRPSIVEKCQVGSEVVELPSRIYVSWLSAV
jgi:hypothetical protein